MTHTMPGSDEDRWEWIRQLALDNIDEIRKRQSKAVVEQLLACVRLYDYAEAQISNRV